MAPDCRMDDYSNRIPFFFFNSGSSIIDPSLIFIRAKVLRAFIFFFRSIFVFLCAYIYRVYTYSTLGLSVGANKRELLTASSSSNLKATQHSFGIHPSELHILACGCTYYMSIHLHGIGSNMYSHWSDESISILGKQTRASVSTWAEQDFFPMKDVVIIRKESFQEPENTLGFSYDREIDKTRRRK